MTSILWYQPAIINSDDVVTCNRIIQQNIDEKNYYFRELNKIADKVIGKRKPWCGKIDKYFFIKGHLAGTDEKGRMLSFMFTCDNKNYKEALNQELDIIGYKLEENTENCLLLKKKDSTIRYFLITIAIIAILIIIFSLFDK